MNDFRFRQVHLDFHTSPLIENIGVKFNKEEWQKNIQAGHVDSITVFSKCHHGYSYHPTKANEMHPHLHFDLLKAQLDACREIGVKAPVYISAGFDEKEAHKHPEWVHRYKHEKGIVEQFKNPGFHLMCFNTAYLDLLIAQIEEVMELYDPCEIFLDIVGERACYCPKCLADMAKEGFDSDVDEDVCAFGRKVYRNYLDRTYEAVKKHNPKTVIYQNSGHLSKGRPDLVDTLEHFELESLPTGGWGYDHFPMSAAYARTMRENYLGMTGKFHGTWGEFGGFKHPNALIYETALSLAEGAGSSIGDQMHPEGKLNPSTFALIGKAYKQVEEKEPWCKGAKNIADIGVLSVEAMGIDRCSDKGRADFGANRILLETNKLYNFIDKDEDFGKYKLIIIPDYVKFSTELANKTNNYIAHGGKVLLSGISGTDENGDFCLDTGARYIGENELNPTFMIPEFPAVNGKTEYLCRCASHRIQIMDGTVFAYGQNPYFNRTAEHFCSHQHAPNNRDFTYPAGVIKGNVAYIGWEAFSGYAISGDLHLKELCAYAINVLLDGGSSLEIGHFPDRGIATLTQQGNRKILHLLYAHTTIRGMNTEVIEDIVPIFDVQVSVKTDKPEKVLLVPENKELPFAYQDGKATFTVPKVYIHQMVSLEH